VINSGIAPIIGRGTRKELHGVTKWPSEWNDIDIAVKELVSVVAAAALWWDWN
jgi:hypothetical protein